MKRKKISAKVWASIMAAAMVMSTCPTAAFAVTADKVAADGTYTATRHVYRTIEDTDDEWNEYDVDVTVSVKDGKISDITATPKNGYVEADNSSYFSKAYSKKNGIKTLLTLTDGLRYPELPVLPKPSKRQHWKQSRVPRKHQPRRKRMC